ncbi:MAG: hypothetical protein WBD20_10605 [Pirellulaceae bacterium]
MTRKTPMQLIRSLIEGRQTGQGKSKVKVVDCDDPTAQIKVDRVQIITTHQGETKVSAELSQKRNQEWIPLPSKPMMIPKEESLAGTSKATFVTVLKQSDDQPLVESTAFVAPLAQRSPLVMPTVTVARYEANNELQNELPSDGGFGFRILVGEKPLVLTPSKKLNLFYANNVPTNTVFEIELVNQYFVDGAALIKINGTPHRTGKALLEFVPAATQDGQGTRVIEGFGDENLAEVKEFTLVEDPDYSAMTHHIEIEFHFAGEDREQLMKVEGETGAQDRGARVVPGEVIAASLTTQTMYVGRRRETVVLAFNHIESDTDPSSDQ